MMRSTTSCKMACFSVRVALAKLLRTRLQNEPRRVYRRLQLLRRWIHDDESLYKAEVIHRRGPWRTLEAVEFATLE